MLEHFTTRTKPTYKATISVALCDFFMSKQRKSFPLRISEELFHELKAWAEQDMRSVNAQIEFLLKQAVVKRRGSKTGETLDEDQLQEPG